MDSWLEVLSMPVPVPPPLKLEQPVSVSAAMRIIHLMFIHSPSQFTSLLPNQIIVQRSIYSFFKINCLGRYNLRTPLPSWIKSGPTGKISRLQFFVASI